MDSSLQDFLRFYNVGRPHQVTPLLIGYGASEEPPSLPEAEMAAVELRRHVRWAISECDCRRGTR